MGFSRLLHLEFVVISLVAKIKHKARKRGDRYNQKSRKNTHQKFLIRVEPHEDYSGIYPHDDEGNTKGHA